MEFRRDRCGGPEDAEDVVQEALTRAWHKRGQYDPDRGTLSAWLMAITAHVGARQRTKSVFRELDQSYVRDVGLDDKADIAKALRTLPSRQRLAIDCYYFADLSVAETAAAMGVSVGTVKSTLSDARDRLRLVLSGS